jgi:hypothetical protein
MKVWNLSEQAINSLRDLAETGMGFQLVEAVNWGKPTPFIVFNSELAVDISGLGLIPSDDPSVILNNGLSIIESLKSEREDIFTAPSPHSFRLLSSRISTAPSRILKGLASLQASMPSSLVKKIVLHKNRVFHRFSAFNPDKRVNPKTGDFLPGTYATPESEVPFVPSGFAAVGRFALPNNQPASHHYVIEAPAGTTVAFGTVAPAFGQAGGGVEAYFQSAVTNQKIPPTAPSRLPDE